MAYYEQAACVAALGTMTMAIKGSHLLAQGGIRAQVVALSPAETKRGCGYGVSFPCEQAEQVKRLFKGAHFPVTQYLQRGHTP